MNNWQSKYGIAALLLFTLLAAWFAPEEVINQPADISLPLQHKAQLLPTGEAKTGLLPKPRQALSSVPVDVFYLPPPKDTAAEAAALAAAKQQNLPPALPYRYLGRQQAQGRETVFLIRDDIAQVAAQGDVLDQYYRIDQIQPDYIQFTYLPLRATQRLSTGNPS